MVFRRCVLVPKDALWHQKCEAIAGAKTNHKDLPDLVTLLTFNPSKSRGYNIALDVFRYHSQREVVKHCVVNNIHAVEIFKILILKKIKI